MIVFQTDRYLIPPIPIIVQGKELKKLKKSFKHLCSLEYQEEGIKLKTVDRHTFQYHFLEPKKKKKTKRKSNKKNSNNNNNNVTINNLKEDEIVLPWKMNEELGEYLFGVS